MAKPSSKVIVRAVWFCAATGRATLLIAVALSIMAAIIAGLHRKWEKDFIAPLFISHYMTRQAIRRGSTTPVIGIVPRMSPMANERKFIVSIGAIPIDD